MEAIGADSVMPYPAADITDKLQDDFLMSTDISVFELR